MTPVLDVLPARCRPAFTLTRDTGTSSMLRTLREGYYQAWEDALRRGLIPGCNDEETRHV